MKYLAFFTTIFLYCIIETKGDLADELIAKLLEDPHSRDIIQQGKLDYAKKQQSLDAVPPMHLLTQQQQRPHSFRAGDDSTIENVFETAEDIPPMNYRGGHAGHYRAGDATSESKEIFEASEDAPPMNYRGGGGRGGDYPSSYRSGDSPKVEDIPPKQRFSGGLYRAGDGRKQIEEAEKKTMDSLLGQLKDLIEDTLETDKKDFVASNPPQFAVPWKKSRENKRDPQYQAIPWRKSNEIFETKNIEDPAIPLKRNPPNNFAVPWKDTSNPALPLKKDTNPALPLKREANPALPLKKEANPALPLKRETNPALPLKKEANPALPLKKELNPALPLKRGTEWKRDLYDRLINDINELFRMSDEATEMKSDQLSDDLSSIFKE